MGCWIGLGINLDESGIVKVGSTLYHRHAIHKLLHNDVIMATKH